MKRTIYEAPRTVLYRVEVEGVLCASITEGNHNSSATATRQDYVEYDFSNMGEDSFEGGKREWE